MSNKTTNYLFMVLLVIIFAAPLFAQTKETGAIVGTITNDERPMPGVTVTISSPNLIGGTATAYTDADGHYRFPAIAPGVYEVSATLEGFQTVARKEIRLFVGNTFTIDLDLQAQAREELVEISGETPTIDATTTAVSKTVPLEIVENLPKFSAAIDLFTLTPGVGDISHVAYGAGGSQANAYWFDGVDISSPVGGEDWIIPNYNWIEEVQVVGIGAPAEYGGFTGVITNSVSRTGSNTFHGLFETFFENQDLVSNNIDDPALAPDRIDRFTDTTVQLSGKLIQDKLWFFASGQYYYQRYAPFGFPPSGVEAFVKDEQPRILGKLTYKANQNNTLQGFLQWDTYKRDGQAADAFYEPEATGVVDAPEWFWNSSWVSLLKPETILDVRFSGYTSVYDILPKNGQTPQHGDFGTGVISQNYWRNYITDRSRNQLNASVSHYARDFIQGSHDFKFGVEYEHSNADRAETYTGGIYYLDYYGEPYYRYLWEGYDSFGRIRRTSAFAQDNWHITDKLDLSIGVRWDRNHVFLEEAPEIEYKTNPVAPRLGFVYDLKGDATTVLKAHYGHYYEGAITFYIDGIDDFGDRESQFWNGSEWETVSFTPGDTFWKVDPNLKQPYVRQVTIGVDQALPRGSTLSAHYIYRKDEDVIEDIDQIGVYQEVPFVNPLTGQTITVFNRLNTDAGTSFFITNVDALFRNYHGIEIVGGTRFGRKFSLNGSVVWSRARGNVGNTDTGAGGFTTLFDEPNANININGIPDYDPTWEFKLMGYYNFPWQVLGSFYYRHFTGDTWTPLVRIPGSVLDQGARNIFGEPRGSRRLNARNVMDVRLEKGFPIYAGNLKFTVDVFNIFNTGYVLDLETRVDRGTFQDPTSFTSPREVRLGVRYQF